jgi:nitrous oxide reductase
MLMPEYDAREQLAANVSDLMRASDDKKSAKALAAKCRWPETAGPKRRGKKLSERYIRYVLNPAPDAAHSPSLDVITAIANAFGTPAWRLLVDDKTLRVWMVGKLFTTSEGVSDQEVEKHLPLPPGAAPAGDVTRKRRPSQ